MAVANVQQSFYQLDFIQNLINNVHWYSEYSVKHAILQYNSISHFNKVNTTHTSFLPMDYEYRKISDGGGGIYEQISSQ